MLVEKDIADSTVLAVKWVACLDEIKKNLSHRIVVA